MNYITHRRFKSLSISGPVNLPAMTACECSGGFIRHDGKPLCTETCENAHQYFARNDDGYGMERGRLTQAIQKRLAQRKSIDDPEHQARWDKVWEDPICLKYKRPEQGDYFLWNHDFFNAPIEDLQHIASLVGAKG